MTEVALALAGAVIGYLDSAERQYAARIDGAERRRRQEKLEQA